MKFYNKDYYPTPSKLLDQIMDGVDLRTVQTVLEPSAGTGNIVEWLKSRKSRDSSIISIDCIESDQDFRGALKEKNYHVVFDDFLTFHTFKHYDLILMNPPFSSGAKHLLKAIDMQKDGGAVICILNAETLRNPCDNERIALINILNRYSADIQYLPNAFSEADRETSVDIAVIKVFIPEKKRISDIYEGLKKKYVDDEDLQETTYLTVNDFIKATVKMYEIETEAGLQLIKEYKAMSPFIKSTIEKDSYAFNMIELKVPGDNGPCSENDYVMNVRKKYWNTLFKNKKFIEQMTSNLRKNYTDQIDKLAEYDFSEFNIREIQYQIKSNLIKGVEQCIVDLFDDLSRQYSYNDECSKNIHYYNGWKTNKAWYINKKVILPCIRAYSEWSGKFNPDSYDIYDKFFDIEKVLNYLDNGRTEEADLRSALHNACIDGRTKNIETKYFLVSFYKKGTAHIIFKDEALLKRFNLYGSQKKGWLPRDYGKKAYTSMTEEEKEVVDSFEGESSYRDTIKNSYYYLSDVTESISMLTSDVA